MLNLSNVKKYYSTRLILEISHLEIENGIFWIKGANGSGKTTLLKMIAGLLPFEGDIQLNHISSKSSPVDYRQNISWGEAEPLYPVFLTGMDMLLLYRSIRRVSKNDMNKLIEIFKMTEYINTKIGSYSTGMLKKLSLALAFLGNQKLIVLDEALITLDPDGLSSLCSLILENYKNDKTSFILSSHQGLDSRLLAHSKELTVVNQTVL
jgi:ABC-type multidrug transport system, ATPase component